MHRHHSAALGAERRPRAPATWLGPLPPEWHPLRRHNDVRFSLLLNDLVQQLPAIYLSLTFGTSRKNSARRDEDSPEVFNFCLYLLLSLFTLYHVSTAAVRGSCPPRAPPARSQSAPVDRPLDPDQQPQQIRRRHRRSRAPVVVDQQRSSIGTRVGVGVVWCCFCGGFCGFLTWGDGCRGGGVGGSRVDGHLR